MTDLRLLPDAEALVGDCLTDADWSDAVPANLVSKLPRYVIYKTAGTAVHPKFLDKPLIQVAAYAATKDAARELAENARVRLFEAWRAQTRYDAGVIHKVVEVLSPISVRTGTEPDGVFRFDATYQVFTRP